MDSVEQKREGEGLLDIGSVCLHSRAYSSQDFSHLPNIVHLAHDGGKVWLFGKQVCGLLARFVFQKCLIFCAIYIMKRADFSREPSPRRVGC